MLVIIHSSRRRFGFGRGLEEVPLNLVPFGRLGSGTLLCGETLWAITAPVSLSRVGRTIIMAPAAP